MAIDLTSYASIQSNLFVRIAVEEYRTTSSGAYSSQVLRFSDRRDTVTIDSESYTGVGNFMSVSSSSSELRVSSGDLIITLSGIPTNAIAEIVNSKIKGSPVLVYRGLYNATTGNLLVVSPNPVGRFKGFVNNFSLNEEYDIESRTSSNTIVLTCSSAVSVLENKIAGRRTNPKSQKSFYSSDLAMDRVPALKDSTFDFGVKQ